MGTSDPRRAKRWIAAFSVSLAVHAVLLVVMMAHQAHAPLVELPVVEIAIATPPTADRRPVESPPPAPRHETPPPPAPRPVEAPPTVAPLPIPAPPRPAPAPAAPVAPAPPAEVAGGAFRLGCEGRAFESLPPEEQRRCVRDLAATQRTFSPGEQKGPALPPSGKEKQFAIEAAANKARNTPLGTNPTKTMGCLEASMGVGCTEDRLGVVLYKQKF